MTTNIGKKKACPQNTIYRLKRRNVGEGSTVGKCYATTHGMMMEVSIRRTQPSLARLVYTPPLAKEKAKRTESLSRQNGTVPGDSLYSTNNMSKGGKMKAGRS